MAWATLRLYAHAFLGKPLPTKIHGAVVRQINQLIIGMNDRDRDDYYRVVREFIQRTLTPADMGFQ